jgi:hypothetical protein
MAAYIHHQTWNCISNSGKAFVACKSEIANNNTVELMQTVSCKCCALQHHIGGVMYLVAW